MSALMRSFFIPAVTGHSSPPSSNTSLINARGIVLEHVLGATVYVVHPVLFPYGVKARELNRQYRGEHQRNCTDLFPWNNRSSWHLLLAVLIILIDPKAQATISLSKSAEQQRQ